MLPDENTPEDKRRKEIFIAGTEPKKRSNLAQFEEQRNADQIIKITVDSSLSNPGGDDTSSVNFNRATLRRNLAWIRYISAVAGSPYDDEPNPVRGSGSTSIAGLGRYRDRRTWSAA